MGSYLHWHVRQSVRRLDLCDLQKIKKKMLNVLYILIAIICRFLVYCSIFQTVLFFKDELNKAVGNNNIIVDTQNGH